MGKTSYLQKHNLLLENRETEECKRAESSFSLTEQKLLIFGVKLKTKVCE